MWWLCCRRLAEEDDYVQDQDEMDPEIAAAYEQFLEEMMQNEITDWTAYALNIITTSEYLCLSYSHSCDGNHSAVERVSKQQFPTSRLNIDCSVLDIYIERPDTGIMFC